VTDVSRYERLARARFWKWLAPLGNVVGVVCGLIGVIVDMLSAPTRVLIVIFGALLLVSASIGSSLVSRAQQADQEEVGQLRARLTRAGVTDQTLPDHALRMIAPVIFHPRTSWRLTVLILEGDGAQWSLRPRLRCASSELYEAIGRPLIPLESSVLRELKSLDLPASGEVGEAPDRESAAGEWQEWQKKFVGDADIVHRLRMPTRKYAWCAARQPGYAGRTIALVAETIQPGGIKVDVLASDLLSPFLEMVLRLVDLPEAISTSGGNASP
jgi:hypothetical protein